MAASMIDAPASSAVVVTPSNTVPLPLETKGLFIGGGGNVSVLMRDGQTCVFTGVVQGQILPIRVTRVNSTGTTATNIVAMYG